MFCPKLFITKYLIKKCGAITQWVVTKKITLSPVIKITGFIHLLNVHIVYREHFRLNQTHDTRQARL